MHLADAFIHSDLQYIQAIRLYCQYACSLGIEPTTFALLTQYSNHWATGAPQTCIWIVNHVILWLNMGVMTTYNIYIVIRETGQFSSKGIINDFIGNLNRLTVSRRFTEQAV